MKFHFTSILQCDCVDCSHCWNVMMMAWNKNYYWHSFKMSDAEKLTLQIETELNGWDFKRNIIVYFIFSRWQFGFKSRNNNSINQNRKNRIATYLSVKLPKRWYNMIIFRNCRLYGRILFVVNPSCDSNNGLFKVIVACNCTNQQIQHQMLDDTRNALLALIRSKGHKISVNSHST